MIEQNKTIHSEQKIITWKIPEYEKYNRTKKWYIIAILVVLSLLIYSFFSNNFLFTIIIIASALIIILHDGQDPNWLTFSLTKKGIIVGEKFYDYDQIKNFSIIYKPEQEVKNIYFEFKNTINPRLSIPLKNMDPLPIRKNLLKYLPEDLERTEQPNSEILAKLFKL